MATENIMSGNQPALTEVRIRPADVHDAPFLAWLILTAGRAHVGRGIWEVILRQSEEFYLNFLKVLTASGGPHPFHYSCYLVAEAGEGAAAGLGGFDPDTQGYPKLMETLPEVFGKLGATPPGELAAGKPPRITASIPPSLSGAWVIDSVATRPAFRRKGLVDQLLDHILDIGRRKGYRRAQLSIYMGNIPAQRAYKKHGFKLLDEWPDPYFEKEIGAPGMARMVRDL